MSTIFGDIRFLRGLEENLPSLQEGQPAFTEDTKRIFVGSNDGNIELQTKEDMTELTNSVSANVEEIEAARGGLPDLNQRLEVLNDSLTTNTSDITDLKKKTDWVDISKYGYDLNAVKSAIATLKDGDTLYFPNALTTYQFLGEAVTITVPNITLRGTGKIYMDYGFRSTESGFVMDGLRLECPIYSSNAFGFRVDQPPTGKVVQDFHIRNCQFVNFFYACYFQGGVYGAADPSVISIRDVIIENCKSFTYTDKNAGHFQCLQTENVSYIDNRTYGGVNATSYNAIQTNGHVKIIGNYDDNNAYGSCEVENQGSKTVIANNTFRKQIWVDDSSDVIIADNNVEDDIFISVEKYGVNNIQIVGNICARVKLDSFGSNYVAGMLINNVSIRDNKFINGANKAHGVFVNGTYCGKVIIQGNDFPATYSTAKVSASRASTLDLVVVNNDVNGSILVTGTGGKLTSFGNLGASYTSTAPDEGESTSALPTAGLAYRGKITVLRGAAGVADLLYVCKKQADGSYAWIQIG
jgi:hypothetical protein